MSALNPEHVSQIITTARLEREGAAAADGEVVAGCVAADERGALRQNLRDAVRSSIFFDGPRFARQFCDTMWEPGQRHSLV